MNSPATPFDLLDPSEVIRDKLVSIIQRIGKLTLNRNPDNVFAETEQDAFHPGHLVPGIDFTDDPLLRAGCPLLPGYAAPPPG